MKLVCTNCGGRLNIPERLYGKKGKCPKCGEVISIPHEDIPVLNISEEPEVQDNNTEQLSSLFKDINIETSSLDNRNIKNHTEEISNKDFFWNCLSTLLIFAFFAFVIKSGCESDNQRAKDNAEVRKKVISKRAEVACGSIKTIQDEGMITSIASDGSAIYVKYGLWLYFDAEEKTMLVEQASACREGYNGIGLIEIRDSQSGRTLAEMKYSGVKLY